ncbi:MAG TPA: DegV family protein [Peptococcaceae bacterium]|nr:MAG: DegV family protein [Clostridia bacterium 41_269]HBT20860.1 DegV family protein [Peptococcaceae bacterium]
MNVKTHIVTDSTAYVDQQWLKDYPFVHVVPLTVHFPDMVMEDRVENNDLFMKKLKELEKLNKIPGTSQPSPGKFVEVFAPLVERGHEIVVITISSGLSGTYQSALNAAQVVGKDKISVVDSKTTAAAQKILVEYAARASFEGVSRNEIVSFLENKRRFIKLYLIPDNLEYLRRGGRIGKAQVLLGTLLNIKPILHINEEGIIDVFDKVRTRRKAFKRIAEEIPENAVRTVVAHFEGEDYISEFKSIVEEKVSCEVELYEAGPVIGTHGGPGVTGVIFEIPEN